MGKRVKSINDLSELSSFLENSKTEEKVVKKPKLQPKLVEKVMVEKPVIVNVEKTFVASEREPKKIIYDAKEKEEYQAQWVRTKYQHRKMIAKKNRRWLSENSDNSEFKPHVEFPNVYDFICKKFEDEKSRKWVLHIITNFLPLNRAKIVPKLPSDRNTCPLTEYPLTDVKNIILGNREKHLAFTGENTNVVLSGIAVQELNRFVLDYTIDFDTPYGHIINFAIDDLRKKSEK